MKILLTFYLPSGGMETLNRVRAHAFQHHGIDCHLLYLFHAEGKQNNKGISMHITNIDSEIKQILDLEQFDAILINTDYLLMERIRRIGYEGPILYEVQGLGTPDEAKNIIVHAAPYIEKHADVILYPNTQHLISLLQEALPSKKQFCLDNPIDTENFGYNQSLIMDVPVIGWVGRIEANKNWSLFLEICYWMLQWNPKIQIWMFLDANLGDENEKKNFESMLDYLKLRPNLTLYSNIPHERMSDYFSIIGDSGGFLCSTSILEGFGYSVAEALLCKCPVVTSESDGIKNFIIHNQTGKIFPQGDLTKAVEEGKEIIENLEIRSAIRNEGVTYMKQRFSTHQYVQLFVSMLNEIQVK